MQGIRMQRHFSTCKYSKKLIYNICGFAGFYFLSNPHFIRKINLSYQKRIDTHYFFIHFALYTLLP